MFVFGWKTAWGPWTRLLFHLLWLPYVTKHRSPSRMGQVSEDHTAKVEVGKQESYKSQEADLDS